MRPAVTNSTEWPWRTAWCATFLAIMVLPSPLGATSTTLAISLRKSRLIRASIAGLSQLTGHAQSKSASGLKRPIWASAKRRSSERRARSCSSQSRSMGTHAASSISCQWASKPLRCKALARACRGSRSVLIGDLLEFVVGVETVRDDGRILRAYMLGQGDGDRGRGLALLTAPLEDQAHGIGVRHVTLERLEDRLLQLGGAVAGEQLLQRGGDAAEIVAALGGASEQGWARRRRSGEMVGGTLAAGGVLVCDQRGDMRGILDLRSLVVASEMAGEEVVAVEDAHFVEIGNERERALHVGMRDRVVVEVETDIGRLARSDGQALMDGIGVVRQRQKARPLFGKDLANGFAGILWAAPIGGNAVAPGCGLLIEIGEIGERAGGEERIACISYGLLDSPLLVPPGNRHGASFEAVM